MTVNDDLGKYRNGFCVLKCESQQHKNKVDKVDATEKQKLNNKPKVNLWAMGSLV